MENYPKVKSFRKVERVQDYGTQDELRDYNAWCDPHVIYSSESVPTIRVRGINFIPCISFERDTVQRMRYCPTCNTEDFPQDNNNYCPTCLSNGIKVKTIARHQSQQRKFYPKYTLTDKQVISAARYMCGYKDKAPRVTPVRFIEGYDIVNGKQVAVKKEQKTYTQDVVFLRTIPQSEEEVARMVDWERTARANDVIFTTTTEAEYQSKKNKYKNEMIDSQLQERIDSLQLPEEKRREYCEKFSVVDLSFITKGQANQILNDNGYYRRPLEETKPVEEERLIAETVTIPKNNTEEDEIPEDDGIPLSMRSFRELQELCQKKGLKAHGKKSELLERLMET